MKEVWISTQIARNTFPHLRPWLLMRISTTQAQRPLLLTRLARHRAHFPRLLFGLARFLKFHLGLRLPPRRPMCHFMVSNPFTTSIPAINNTITSNRSSPLPAAGPVRLTRFLDMPRDHFYATMNAMITTGRFNHIGEVSVRSRRPHSFWRASRGAARLRCRVLYHTVNRRTNIPRRGFCGDPILAASVCRLDFRFC